MRAARLPRCGGLRARALSVCARACMCVRVRGAWSRDCAVRAGCGGWTHAPCLVGIRSAAGERRGCGLRSIDPWTGRAGEHRRSQRQRSELLCTICVIARPPDDNGSLYSMTAPDCRLHFFYVYAFGWRQPRDVAVCGAYGRCLALVNVNLFHIAKNQYEPEFLSDGNMPPR